MKKILFALLFIALLTPSFREIDEGYRHTKNDDNCSSCHAEFTDPDVNVAPDWYPEFGTLNGELVTIWKVDGDNCTINSGEVVPCWYIEPIPPLPPCNKGLPVRDEL